MATPNSVFYRHRAEEADRLAGESHLMNVRQNLLEAARAWRVMAKSAKAVEDAVALRRAKELPDS